MQKIRTCLWFDHQAEDAVKLYTSIFKNSKILSTSYYTEAGPRPKGEVMLITFQVEGQELMALNGGPEFKFSEAISLSVSCETQEEIDELTKKLSADGKLQCGWLKDKFGLSWQIVPTILERMMTDKDIQKVERVGRALLQMKKLDIAALKRAYEGKS
jgi:predicted 3-demethylubiquinone-9 3-methyltransferase (glyoxalase superfamily)